MADNENDHLPHWEEWVEAELDSATVADLMRSRDVSSQEADGTFDYVTEKNKAKIARKLAENEMRKLFFNWSSKLASWMIAGNFSIFLLYLIAETFSPSEVLPAGVMVAWTTATVVEIVGVVTIVALHLFPGRRSTRGSK